MPFEVRLPDIGEGVAEGEIVRWLVKAGDAVKEDQPLVEVMTDKANVEIPSPRTGTIAALHVEEGAVVPVGTTLVSIEVAAGRMGSATSPAGGAAQAGGSQGMAPSSGATSAAAAAGPGATVQATPAVRQLARELGVALERVSATGPGARITAEDVRRAASGPPPPRRRPRHAIGRPPGRRPPGSRWDPRSASPCAGCDA